MSGAHHSNEHHHDSVLRGIDWSRYVDELDDSLFERFALKWSAMREQWEKMRGEWAPKQE